MLFFKLVIIFLFTIQLYSSNHINDEYIDMRLNAYDRFELNEYDELYDRVVASKKKSFSGKVNIEKIKTDLISFLTIVSLAYENEKMIMLMLKYYNNDIAILYQFVFKEQKIKSLKILMKYKIYNYNDNLFNYEVLLFNNKTTWPNKLLDSKYLYISLISRFSSLGYLIDKCNLKMMKIAMSRGADIESNSNLLDLAIIKRCYRIASFLHKEGYKGNLLLHILRDDYQGVQFLINRKSMRRYVNEIKTTIIQNADGLKENISTTILDYAICLGNKIIINSLRKYGAKRACELLKENSCRDLPLGRD